MPNLESAKTRERILGAAANLFSKLGYNGASARDVARAAEVNEATVYRHYPCKRDLFIAMLDAELSKVQFNADLLLNLATAADANQALAAMVHLIREAVLKHSGLVRLIHFSVLEFGSDLDQLYRRHIHEALQEAAKHLDHWPELTPSREFDTQITVLAFAATMVTVQNFYPVLSGRPLSQDALEQAAQTCANLWHAALTGTPAS